MKRLHRFLLPSVALLLLWGCATGGGRGSPETEGIRVVVQNDLSPPTVLTVRVLGAGTAFRTILGSVSPSSTRTFVFQPSSTRGDYQLVAEKASGEDVSSRVFQVTTGDDVRWSVRRNAVDLRRQ